MEIAHALAADGAPEHTLVFAARQEQGRGRLGRTWQSPEGGAYFSFIVRPTRGAGEIPQLSLVAGLAAAEAIYELSGLHPAIRWPNDLLMQQQKVCGILVEAKSGAAVVGIGLNVATPLSALPKNATSLETLGASCCDPYQLTGAVCRHFQSWYDTWGREGFTPIRQALRPWMAHFGQPVHLTAGEQRFEGIATDLDESGRLVVRLDSGLHRAFEMGEVTLLK